MWTSVLEGQNDLHESVKGRVMTSGSSDTPASIFSTKQLKAASFYTHLRSAEELNEDILTHTHTHTPSFQDPNVNMSFFLLLTRINMNI